MRNINFGRGLKYIHKMNMASTMAKAGHNILKHVQDLRHHQNQYMDSFDTDNIGQGMSNLKLKKISKLKYKF
jgi:hypothetical protein